MLQDLRAINNMLRMNERSQQASKRLLQEDNTSEQPQAKKLFTGTNSSPAFHKRLEMLVKERQASNGDH